MSATAIIWICCFVTFALLAFRRAAWGVALYLLVYYIDPDFWWWGTPIKALGLRLSMLAALILAAAVFSSGIHVRPRERKVFLIFLLYSLNATVVHYALACNPQESFANLNLLWKNLGLLLLMTVSIKDQVDWRIFLYSIVIGSLYIGFEMVINERGHFVHGRYEAAVAAAVTDSEFLAAFLAMAVPLAGAFFLFGNKWEKILAFGTLWLICETIVRCNTRGTFLALVVSGVWLLVTARGRSRRYAVVALLLASICAALLVRNDLKVVRRFLTTFESTESTSGSANSRINFWTAAIQMGTDYPLGSGGGAAFNSDRGFGYIQRYGETHYRAVHNGPLDILCGWGFQGLALYLLGMYSAWRILRDSIRSAQRRHDWRTAFFGMCLETALLTQLVAGMFISTFDQEWFLWLVAASMGFGRAYASDPVAVCPSHVLIPWSNRRIPIN